MNYVAIDGTVLLEYSWEKLMCIFKGLEEHVKQEPIVYLYTKEI